jgi:Fe-S oxidoreductase
MATATVLETSDLTLDGLLASPLGRPMLSCIQCGTCAGTCPHGEHMRYTPRRLIGMLREGLADEVVASDDLLSCVICYDCWAKCPRGLHLSDVLLPLVKEQVLLRLSEVPAELQGAMSNTMRYGNPMGESPRKRAAWAEDAGVPVPILRDLGRPVGVLWFLDCYASYYPRGQQNARATARVLAALGVDFAILGPEEKCSGEATGRLVGETGLFDTLREQNMATFAKYEFGSLLTSDPHAFDAFSFAYRSAGLTHPVHHTSVFLADHLDALRPLLTKELGYTVTYHDSCVLGRHNHIHEQPRQVLEALPGVRLVEMTHNRDNTICCGGGGGGMWLDTHFKAKGHVRLSDIRVQEAIETGADVLAVSCPFEVPRFEDSLKVLGHDDRMVVRDVMELVDEALGN